MPASDSDNEARDEREDGIKCTILSDAVYQKALADMKAKPDIVLTFDHEAELLVPWIWPSKGNDVPIQPSALKTALDNTGIEPPVCFCSSIRNDKLIIGPSELIKRGGVWQFSCRRKNGCGYLVRLDNWNPRLTIREPMNRLAKMPNTWSFTRARWSRPSDENSASTADTALAVGDSAFATHGRGHDGPGPSRASSAGMRIGGRAAPYQIRERAETPSLILSPPRMTLERVRRPYGSSAALPAPPNTPSTSATHQAAASDHIPPALLDLAYLTTTDGLSEATFGAAFVRCKCGNLVYRPALESFHLPLCSKSPSA